MGVSSSRSRRSRVCAAIGLAGLALLAMSDRAWAVDWCFHFNDPFQTSVVAKRYSKPSRGSCKPIVGFEFVDGATTRAVSGAACLNSAGNLLRVGLTIHPSFGPGSSPAVLGQINFPYPGGPGFTLVDGVATLDYPTYSLSSTHTGARGGPCAFPIAMP